MSCKSGIYAVNTAVGTAIADGGTYVPNTIIRRFGANCQLAGNGISISGAGYYRVDVVPTVTATAAGTNVTSRLLLDGVPVIGATSAQTATAIGDEVALPISAIVRLNCNCDTSNLTVTINGQATTAFNLSVNVEKL